jgi:ATP-dependent helicase HrpB
VARCLARESGVINHEVLVAVDVTSASSLPGADALIRMATGIEREWLVATSEETRHEMTDAGAVRGVRVERYDALVISERQVVADPDARAAVLADAWRRRDPDDATARLMRRVAFAGLGDDVSLDALVMETAAKARRLDDMRPAAELPGHLRHALDKVAPETLTLPSGRAARLDYRDDGRIVAAVKLQELFGLADTPRLGSAKTPVTFELLAPNGRPVQVTTDLRSFWTTGYPEVRKELRARYPRHPWPEDPWSATPTARTVSRLPKKPAT